MLSKIYKKFFFPTSKAVSRVYDFTGKDGNYGWADLELSKDKLAVQISHAAVLTSEFAKVYVQINY